MKIQILTDNLALDGFEAEWGLSVYIEYEGKKILLDTGTTGLFAENAKKLGVRLEDVDAGVLSHNHDDHANGIEEFFSVNSKAKFYIRAGIEENTFTEDDSVLRYAGILPGVLKRFRDRFVFADGDYELYPDVFLIPHKTPGLEKIGEKVRMFQLRNGEFVPDDFSHEQSLVFRTAKGLVIFNSCSHGGADNIINEISRTFSGERLYAIIGGFHLFKSSEEEIAVLAKRIAETGIRCVITGHCSEERGYELMKPYLGESLRQMKAGLTFEL